MHYKSRFPWGHPIPIHPTLMYVCFNDSCPYLVEGWETTSLQGNAGFSYRPVYDPARQVFFPVAVPNLNITKDGILE